VSSEPAARTRLQAAPPLAINPWVIAVVVTMATFMETLDTTIANVSLPHIAGNLSAGQDESTWVLTSYLVSNAIVLPISGWLSLVFGRKRFYMTCVALFTASSFLCGLAPSLPWLIFFRILQGLGGGGLQPSEQAILVDTFPPAKRGMAFAVAGIATIVAPIVGPTLGGWITDSYSWRWCFYVNVPVGVLSLFLTYQLVRDPGGSRPTEKATEKRPPLRIDFSGLGLIALGLGAMQIVLDKGERLDWLESNFIVLAIFVSVVALVAATFQELRHPNPVADVKLLGNRNFGIACMLMFMVGFALFGTTVLVPQLLQTLLGYSAMQAGLVLSPGGVVILFLMPMVGILVTKFQPRFLITFGFVVAALGIFQMQDFNLLMDARAAVIARCLQTFGVAFLFVPVNTAAYSMIPPGKNNNASALLALARNSGASVGIAFVTTLLARRAQAHQATLISHLTPFDPTYRATLAGITERLTRSGLAPGEAALRAQAVIVRMLGREASMLAYGDAFKILGTALLGMAPFALLLRPGKATKGGPVGH
jgi:DHA2 family multidrug resistance protein